LLGPTDRIQSSLFVSLMTLSARGAEQRSNSDAKRLAYTQTDRKTFLCDVMYMFNKRVRPSVGPSV